MYTALLKINNNSNTNTNTIMCSNVEIFVFASCLLAMISEKYQATTHDLLGLQSSLSRTVRTSITIVKIVT